MTITHKLALDLQKKEDLQRLDAVQGDVLSRCVELTLTSGDNPWVIPVCDVVVRYLKPDGTAGVYDTLPDGTPAASVSGNVLMLTLAPQMLTCAGAVQVQVELNSQEQRLATFMFLVSVEQAVALNEGSEDYVNWDKFYLPQTAGAQQGQLLRIAEVGDKGQVTALEPVDPPEAELSARMEQLENHFDDVAQRSEDAMQNAADAVRLAANAVPCPQSAQAGQVLAVKSVDENGKPSQWETVEQQTGDQGDLDLHGNWLYNAGSMEVGDPSEPEAAWYVTYGIPIEGTDGRVTPVAEFWGSAADDHVLLRFVADGVEPSDAVNKGQLDTKLPQPAAAIVGQYLRIADVAADGKINAVEAVDAPGVDSEHTQWKTLGTFDLSGGAAVYQCDDAGCAELLVIVGEDCAGAYGHIVWKGVTLRHNSSLCVMEGSYNHIYCIDNHVIFGHVSRGGDTLTQGLAYTVVDPTDTMLTINFHAATASGKIFVYGR